VQVEMDLTCPGYQTVHRRTSRCVGDDPRTDFADGAASG
jgi:hypothetical protein